MLFIVVYITLFIFFSLLFPDLKFQLQRGQLNNAISPSDIRFRTGDLVLFFNMGYFIQLFPKRKIIFDNLIYCLMRGFIYYTSGFRHYTHYGFIVIVKNEPYIYHIQRRQLFCSYQRCFRDKQPVLQPLSTVLKNLNAIAWHVPYRGRIIDVSSVQKVMNCTAEFSFPNNWRFFYQVYFESFRNNTNTIFPDENVNEIICINLIGRIFHILKMFQVKNYNSFLPNELFNILNDNRDKYGPLKLLDNPHLRNFMN